MIAILGWLWFIAIQIVAAVLAVIGLPVVAALSAAGAWHYGLSDYRAGRLMRVVEKWNGGQATWIFGNEEDGVLGPIWYNPDSTRWRAFKWSALRNPCNNLRFLVAWKGGPWFQRRFTIGGAEYYVQLGFRPDTGWPVLSAGSGTGTVL